MRLEIPFIRSETDKDCGQLALKMALNYFGESFCMEEISKLTKTLPSGLTWTFGISVAANTLGYGGEVFSSSNFSHEEEIGYYDTNSGNEGLDVLHELRREGKRLEIPLNEKDLSLDELKDLISENSLVIVLLNWNAVKGIDGYQGHFVLLTGYDNDFFYFHNPGFDRQGSDVKLSNELFKEAWESKGTDKDLIVISRKNPKLK